MPDTNLQCERRGHHGDPAPAKPLDRQAISARIASRILDCEHTLTDQWRGTAPINHFVLDELLPAAWAEEIRAAFPDPRAMTLRRSLRELKYVAAQMDEHHPLLEEAIYAFQAPAVVDVIGRISGLTALEPDERLYAGGISLMAPGHFLNPHIDNSHDKFRRRYRVLNLLYYVSPGWPDDRGGNLELWPQGLRGPHKTIASRFNRLAVMITHRRSWHSVSRNAAGAVRCCVSNYYFSPTPPVGDAHYYHVTEFRGRPEQPFRDLALRADNHFRTFIRTRFPGAFRNPHFYDNGGTAKSAGDRSGR